MLMECPSHMETLHVNTSGHNIMLVVLKILHSNMVHTIVQNSTTVPPPYVGTDYYCESGTYRCCYTTYFYNDSLWDGQQCDYAETSCCTHPNMPWFIKTLNETTIEDIELRLCKNKSYIGDTPLELFEVFVQ